MDVEQDMLIAGETFTERCRKMLAAQPSQSEFTLSRGGLEVLLLDSERYGQNNKAGSDLLMAARDIASDTTTMARDAEEWLSGNWDHQLPRLLREIADHRLKTIGVVNREMAVAALTQAQPATQPVDVEAVVDQAAKHVWSVSRRGNASINEYQADADKARMLDAYRDIIRKALPITKALAAGSSGVDREVEIEKMGEALFALSDKLAQSGFLDNPDHHAVYERTVNSWDAILRALNTAAPGGDECRKCDDSGYITTISGGIWTGEGVSESHTICDCACGDDVRREQAGIAPPTDRTPTPGDDDEETYQIGKRDGYEEAVADIDQMTGGDGEYFASTIPGRGVPDAPTMAAGIAERFAALTNAGRGSVVEECAAVVDQHARLWTDEDVLTDMARIATAIRALKDRK